MLARAISLSAFACGILGCGGEACDTYGELDGDRISVCFDSSRNSVLVVGKEGAADPHTSITIWNMDSNDVDDLIADSRGGFAARMPGNPGDIVRVYAYAYSECEEIPGDFFTFVAEDCE